MPVWGDREELLASVVDRLGLIDYLLRRAHFKGNAEPPRPVPRPGQDDLDGEPASFDTLG